MLFRDKIGERAKRASLEEDENTRDESTPAKWPQTATHPLLELTYLTIFARSLHSFFLLKMRLASHLLRSAQFENEVGRSSGGGGAFVAE